MRHVALALGSLCNQAGALVTITSEPMAAESGPARLGGISHKLKDNIVCLDIDIFHNISHLDNYRPFHRSRHFSWFPAGVIVYGMILASLIYLSGSADPAHLAAQGHILYLSSLAEREQFELNCRKSSQSHYEKDVSTEEQRDNLSSTPFHLIRKLRALLLNNTDDVWRLLELEEPGFEKAYREILDQRERELDASIVADIERLQTRPNRSAMENWILESAERRMSSEYPNHGLGSTGSLSRSLVRRQMIALSLESHIGTEPGDPACALPEVTKWYNHYIRPFLESFSARTGIVDVQEESPAHPLADPRVTVKPQHDPGIERLLFSRDSIEIAQNPFALLYYGASFGNLALVKRYPMLTRMTASGNGSLAPIFAAIENKHHPVIDWLLVNDPYCTRRHDVVLAAARVGGEIFKRVMNHMDVIALNGAFQEFRPPEDEQEFKQEYEHGDVVEVMIEWLKNNRQKDTSLYIGAMGAAAAYNRWEDVKIFLQSHAIVDATFHDLFNLDIDDDEILQSIVKRAEKSHGEDKNMMIGLFSLLERAEAVQE